MRNLFLASVALAAAMLGSALAADMPLAPVAAPVAYYDWSGAYVGFNIGGAWYDVTHHFTTPGAITPDVTTSDSDAIFGFHAGARWQWGQWVLGVEAALSGCANECRSTSPVLPVALGFDPNIFGEHKITNLFTAGPRIGYAWDRWLIFASGAGPRPISRTHIAPLSRRSVAVRTAPRATTTAGTPAAASTTWCTRAHWST
jgi:outer membrane immunogenic protein